MSTLSFVFICIQACLIQNAFSQQCLGAYGPAAFAPAPNFGYDTGYAELDYPTFNGAAGYPGYANSYTTGYGAAPYGLSGLAYDGLAYPAAVGCGAAYGGAGEGNVAVAGELPACGNTVVAGQVPIMGAVTFGGTVPAAGAVSVNGNCACGCGCPSYYY